MLYLLLDRLYTDIRTTASRSHLKNYLDPDREVDFEAADFDRTANPKRGERPHLNPEVSRGNPAQMSTYLKIVRAVHQEGQL